MNVTTTDLAKLLSASLERLPANQAAGVLMSGLIARIVINIDEGRWREMLDSAEAPCGKPGCSCENDRMSFFNALDELRTNFLQQAPEVRS